VGVSVGKVHSATADLIFNSEIENERGQLRPMQYAARDVELIQMDKLPGDDGKYRPMHSVAGDLISEIGIENARARVGEPF
jgi:hypothetical protein